MKRRNAYITMEEKKALFLAGKDVPICVGNSMRKNSFIAKLRGTIFDGALRGKILKL